MKALFIGGTGTISMATTRRVATLPGWELYLLNRGSRSGELPPNVHVLTADVNDAATVRRVTENHRFDVVANFIAYHPEDVRRDVELFRGRTGQYMFVSTCAAYRKPFLSYPVTESAPQANPLWEYAALKIECEQALAEAFSRDGFAFTTVRPSHTYDDRRLPVGVGGSGRAWTILQRMRRGKPVIAHGDGTSLWTVTHADDFAVGFTGLMGNRRALGQAVNLVSDDVYAWDAIYGIYADVLGVEYRAAHIASAALARERAEFAGGLLGDKAHSLIFDNRKLRELSPDFQTRQRLPETARRIIGMMEKDASLQVEDAEFDAWCDAMIERYA